MGASRRSRALVALGILQGLLASGWPAVARAYRPFDGTDAAVAGRGEVEAEIGPLGYVAAGGERRLVAPGLILNWGFADRMELVLEGRNTIRLGSDPDAPRSRLEDDALSLKTVLREGSLQERLGPSVAAELSLLLPEVRGATGAGLHGGLIVSQRWSAATVHLNGAVERTREKELGLVGGAILELHDAWPVRPVAELLVSGERRERATVSGLVGAVWRVRDGLSLDVALRRAVGPIDATEIRAGLTWGGNVGVPR